MAPEPRPSPDDPRLPLSRARVLAAAVDLADRDGLGSITMRKVGEALGVEAMSLYNHLANKSDLLDGMVDAVFTEIELPTDPAVGWKDAMRVRSASARRVLGRHPWAVGLTDSRRSPGPATMRHHDEVLGVLFRAGFSLALAGHAFATLDSYTYGYALQEAALPVSDAAEVTELAAEIFEVNAPEAYPHMARFATEYATVDGYEFAAEFDWGLDLVLDGLERAFEAERDVEERR